MPLHRDKVKLILSVFADDPTPTRGELERARAGAQVYRQRRMKSITTAGLPLVHTFGEAPWAGSGPGEDSDGVVHGVTFWRCAPRCVECLAAAAAYRRELRAQASVA